MRKRFRWLLLAAILVLGGLGGASISYGVYMKVKAVFAEELLDGAWANMLAGKKAVRPWPWADTTPFAKLEVPALGVNEVVLRGGSGRTLAFGPGHIDGTVEPGADGNCALIGHRDTSFAFLERIAAGDPVFLTSSDNIRHEYRVAFTKVVTKHDTWVYADTRGPALTLVTCYPFHSLLPGDARYVVRAVLKQ